MLKKKKKSSWHIAKAVQSSEFILETGNVYKSLLCIWICI